MQLTDSMIERALQDTVYVTESPWTIIGILGAVVVFLLFIFFASKNTRQKVCSGLLAVMFIIGGIVIISRNSTGKNYIENGEWYVVTDTVDRVMESEKNGRKSYFMVLDKYGRVSLDSYSEAIQYYAGATVYLVVIPDGGGYKSTGVAYNTDDYVYVGNH